jgi:hypothetical protein
MARAQKLKVYRTPIGFHDAYVAAPSQKAALEAWGADANLFARGIAELVEDPELTREPLEKPGAVIRRLRGTAAEQLAALPADPPRHRAVAPRDGQDPEDAVPRRRKASPAAKATPKPKPKPKLVPRPDRTALDKAQEAMEEIEARHRRERDALAAREAELAKKRRATEKAHDAEVARAQKEIDRAEAAYERAMRKWRG